MNKKLKPSIVFEDEHLVFVNKPPGVLSIPDRYREDLFNVQTYIHDMYGSIYTIHRIDKDTSGLMVFAKNDVAHKTINTLFENRQIFKSYLAIVEGQFPNETLTVNEPLLYNKVAKRMEVNPKGKESTSHFSLLESFQTVSLIKAEIETGRMHQIRTHLRFAGYPLIVDSIYGFKDAFYLSEIKRKRMNLAADQKEWPLLSRQALHSAVISFAAFGNEYHVDLSEQLPKDLKAVLYQLRKLSKKE